jgi:hypothetical protein
MATEEELLHELMYYTLAHADPAFIHQHAVDAYAVQNATQDSKPITVMFGLIGLYLHLERGFTGRQVQRVHMQLGTPRRTWPMPELPEHRGTIRVADVLKTPPGRERDLMIDQWCNSVWQACEKLHSQIREIAGLELGI